jgi:hypothetical protein
MFSSLWRVSFVSALCLSLTTGCGGGGGGGSAPAVTQCDPATAPSLLVSWMPNSDPVDGYFVYYGLSANTATTVASRLSADVPGFDPSAPAVVYNSCGLQLSAGQSVCFRLRAFNNGGLSAYSTANCIGI